MVDETPPIPEELLAEIIAAVAVDVAAEIERQASNEIDGTINRKAEKQRALEAVRMAATKAVVYFTRPVTEGLIYNTPQEGEEHAANRTTLRQEIGQRYIRKAKSQNASRQAAFKDGKRLIP